MKSRVLQLALCCIVIPFANSLVYPLPLNQLLHHPSNQLFPPKSFPLCHNQIKRQNNKYLWWYNRSKTFTPKPFHTHLNHNKRNDFFYPRKRFQNNPFRVLLFNFNKLYRTTSNNQNQNQSKTFSKPESLNEDNLENKNKNARPLWACNWMPTWLVTLHPVVQFIVGSLLYFLHLTVFTQRGIAFPFQLIPNDNGKFQYIGLDSVAGILSMIGLFWLRKQTKSNEIPAVPKILNDPTPKELPWKNLHSKKMKNIPISASARAFTYLLIVYTATGAFTSSLENLLYVMAGMGVPMTIAMHRSLVVLLGHLTWVGLGCLILEWELKPFFNRKKTKWYKLKWDTYWLWWTIGGYFVSAWFFNVADFINQMVLAPSIFEEAGEGVVSQLINPENNDLAASIVGYIAPCISAPWWEEILYRGFILPTLCLHMSFWPASFLSAIIFSAHHMSTTGFIPLAVLGMTWGTLYAKCGNLLVTILIHAMWNSRVFLGSWFGL